MKKTPNNTGKMAVMVIIILAVLSACTKTTTIERIIPPDKGSSSATATADAGTENGSGGTDQGDAAKATPAPAKTPSASPQQNTASSATPSATGGSPRQPEDAGRDEFSPTPEPTPVVMPSPSERSRVFKTEALGTLVTAPEGTTIAGWQKPEWVKAAIAESGFVRPDGKVYTVLVYRKNAEETAEDWMARSELGDAYVSPKTVLTKNGATGYVYTSNDYGAIPAVHITVMSREFVYYFHSDESEKEVPEDFLKFVMESEVK